MNLRNAIVALSACALTVTVACAQRGGAVKLDYAALNSQAASEYLQPVHRGGDGTPYWNAFAKRFVYAPAFDFPRVKGAAKYIYTLTQDGKQWTFEAGSPNEALSPVWSEIPVGQTTLTVAAVNAKGKSVGQKAVRSFMRDFPFRGPYSTTAHGYRDAAVKGLMYCHNLDAIKHWLDHTEPDMDFENNTYACKIIGSTVSVECLLARLMPSLQDDAVRMARNAADYLMRISQPATGALPYFPPTYDREPNSKTGWPHRTWRLNQGKTMFLEAVEVAEAYLDLYDVTGERKYYDMALHIADTYQRLQEKDGAFPIKVYWATGRPVDGAKATPSPLLFLIRRLQSQYHITTYDSVMTRAEAWMRENYLKSFNLTGQFEDQEMEGLKPFQNLTNCTANDYAYYLLTKPAPTKDEVATAAELMRLCEDQFVHWDIMPDSATGLRMEYTPNVHEQYQYETPVDDSAGQVGRGFLALYKATGDKLWLAKAVALTNSIATVQNQWNGQVPTTWSFVSKPAYADRTYWPNCTLTSVSQLLRMADFVQSGGMIY